MNRVEENLKVLQDLSSALCSPEVSTRILLMDISRSLSVIADELTRREENHDS